MLAKNARLVSWICLQCAVDSGAKFIKDHVYTMHHGICGVCKKKQVVTEPRDFDWSNNGC